MQKKLNDRTVAELKPSAKRTDYWDLGLPAFGIRVGTNGSKTWVVAVRSGNTSSRRTLGRWPAMKTAEARVRAREEMEGPAAPRTDTFKAAAERFISHGRNRRGELVRAATIRSYRLILERVAEPLHARPIAQIRRGEIADLLHAIAQERGAATAALARNVLGRFFGYLIETDVVETSPVVRSPIYTSVRGSRVLSDNEIKAVWHGATGPFGSIVHLLLILGCRRAEVGQMRWSEIQGDIWTVPPERVKTKRQLQLPLPDLALFEIHQQPRVLGKDMVFGRGACGLTDWSGHKARLDRNAALARPFKLHDLRRTCRTRLHALGVPHEIVIRIMNHDLTEMSAAYDYHTYLPEMRAALGRWSDELARITMEPDATVASIR